MAAMRASIIFFSLELYSHSGVQPKETMVFSFSSVRHGKSIKDVRPALAISGEARQCRVPVKIDAAIPARLRYPVLRST